MLAIYWHNLVAFILLKRKQTNKNNYQKTKSWYCITPESESINKGPSITSQKKKKKKNPFKTPEEGKKKSAIN